LLQDVAELGNPDEAIAEINSAIAQGDAEALYIGSNLGTASVAVLDGQQRSFVVNVSPDYSKISVVSMIAPQVSNPFVPVFRIDDSPVLVNGEIVPFGIFSLTRN